MDLERYANGKDADKSHECVDRAKRLRFKDGCKDHGAKLHGHLFQYSVVLSKDNGRHVEPKGVGINVL